MTETRPFFKAPSSRSKDTVGEGKVSWFLPFMDSLGTLIGDISDMVIVAAFLFTSDEVERCRTREFESGEKRIIYVFLGRES